MVKKIILKFQKIAELLGLAVLEKVKKFVNEKQPEIFHPDEYKDYEIQSSFEILPTLEFDEDFEILDARLHKLEKPQRVRKKKKKKKKPKKIEVSLPPPPPPPQKPETPPPKPPTPPPIEKIIIPKKPEKVKVEFDFSKYKNIHLLHKSFMEKKRLLEGTALEIRPYAWNKDYKISEIKKNIFNKLKLPIMATEKRKKRRRVGKVRSEERKSKIFKEINLRKRDIQLAPLSHSFGMNSSKRRSILRERHKQIVSHPTEFSHRKKNYLYNKHHNFSFDAHSLAKNSLMEDIRNERKFQPKSFSTGRPREKVIQRRRFREVANELINPMTIKFSSPQKYKKNMSVSVKAKIDRSPAQDVEDKLRDFEEYLDAQRNRKPNARKKKRGFMGIFKNRGKS